MNNIRNIIKYLYYLSIAFRNYIFSCFSKKINYKEIPIIINNRNRLTFLKQLINTLNDKGYSNITILDNASTYPPLLEYYKTITCDVIFLNHNHGPNAIEYTPLYKTLKHNYFVYTDPDVIPIDECPSDFLKYFLLILRKYPLVQKVGFSLKIDDLPQEYEDKFKVIEWETRFYKKKINKDLYYAQIDTTFALHRPHAYIGTRGKFKMIRTGYPYTARHLPWYNNSSKLSLEEIYYKKHATIGGHWTNGDPNFNR